MLDKITNEAVSTIINSYKKDATEFACENQKYVEACGLYCPTIHEWSVDMGGGLNKKCNADCPHYKPSYKNIYAENMIAVFNTIKRSSLEKILTTIQENPTCNNADIIMLLMEEMEKPYVE